MLTVYGLTVLTFMMLVYTLERRDAKFVLAFALAVRPFEQLRVCQRRLAVRCG